uniref:Uncharacterized protein n=1 Tax=Arundo donax TaxID=35708 RepID=A0A0A8YVD9_ARUDO
MNHSRIIAILIISCQTINHLSTPEHNQHHLMRKLVYL